MASAEEIFSALTQALQDDDDRKLLQHRFRGISIFMLEGGDIWSFDATKGTLDNVNADDPLLSSSSNNLIQVTTKLQVLQDLLSQKLSPQQAFLQGKLKIKGNMGLAMKLNVVLQAIRKHLPSATPISKL
jgi:hypothetical protein